MMIVEKADKERPASPWELSRPASAALSAVKTPLTRPAITSLSTADQPIASCLLGARKRAGLTDQRRLRISKECQHVCRRLRMPRVHWSVPAK